MSDSVYTPYVQLCIYVELLVLYIVVLKSWRTVLYKQQATLSGLHFGLQIWAWILAERLVLFSGGVYTLAECEAFSKRENV